MSLEILKPKKDCDPVLDRNRHRRLQAIAASIANGIVTCQGIAAVWNPEVREGILAAWPVLTVIFAFNSGVIMTYLFLGSKENRHAAELQAMRDDPRLRQNFSPGTETVHKPDFRNRKTPRSTRDDSPEE